MYLSLKTDFGCRVLTEGLDRTLRVFDLTLAAVLAAVEKLDILLTLTLLLLRSMAERRKGLAKGPTIDFQTCQARKQVSCVKACSKT